MNLLATKKVIAFDMDDTLAVSKSLVDDQMRKLLCRLMEHVYVVVMSGGRFEQFQKQLLDGFTCEHIADGKLAILPTSGSALWLCQNNQWQNIYSEDLSTEEKNEILYALDQALQEVSFTIPSEIWGERIEDRGSQITLSMLGQQAPPEEKKKWDPDISKRKEIQTLLLEKIPQFEIRMGGSTSIDITKKGIDKGYGLSKFTEYMKFTKEDVFFIGDRIIPGGNDYAVLEAGFETHNVANHEETRSFLLQLFTDFGDYSEMKT